MSPGERPASALERLRRLHAGQAVDAHGGHDAGASSSRARRRGVVWGALAAVALVLFKLKGLAFLLLTKLKLLLVALKLGKFLVTGWTMVLMAGVYAAHHGWRFAVGLVLLVLVHELGHALAARAMGMPVGAPVFIPFVGAMIALGRRPRSTWEDFVIAAGGPLLGGLAAGACVAASGLAGDGGGLLLVLGFFGLLMNLFNLTPFWSLDGARMLGVVSWRAGLVATCVSVVALVAIAWAAGHLNPVALIAVAVCAWRFGRHAWSTRRGAPAAALERLRLREAERAAVPDHADATQRRIGLAVYFGTLLGLAAAAHAVFVRLPAV